MTIEEFVETIIYQGGQVGDWNTTKETYNDPDE